MVGLVAGGGVIAVSLAVTLTVQLDGVLRLGRLRADVHDAGGDHRRLRVAAVRARVCAAAPARRGLAMLAVASMIGAASAGLGLLLVGHLVSPPVPQLSQFAVDSIPATFWLCLIWERWPFRRLKSRLGTAASLILACYGVNYGIWELLVGTRWMAGPTLDAASVSAVAFMFLMLQFELWPLTRLDAMNDPPTRGAIWTLVVLGGGIGFALIGTDLFGTPAMVFMARAPIPFIFGCILTLNTFRGSLVAHLEQPLRGVRGSLLAAGGGFALGVAYRALMPTLTGRLSSVSPTYERATWLASSLLGVTFLLLSLYKDFFEFWPLLGKAPQPAEARVPMVGRVPPSTVRPL